MLSRKKSLLACALMAAVASPALAQDQAPSGTQVRGNVALVSDYLFRGISQTWGRPALQAGVDVNDGCWHVGAWTSNVSRNSYPGGGVELDLYGDVGLFRHGDWSVRAGLYGYLYPGANLDNARPPLGSRTLNTLEANASLSWKTWTLKYSRSLTDYFGADIEQGYSGSTRGTQYLQLDGSIPLGGRWSMAPHVGYTDYRRGMATPLANGARDPSYADVGLALKYAPNDKLSVSLGISHAGNDAFYRHVASFRDTGDVRDLGGTRGVLSIAATF
ncbi:MAG TPA: TorF family putative porin [Rhodanobacteraceae bacterium]|nr:TorF family putative porin [Rhodanobacteraceae bacterium]